MSLENTFVTTLHQVATTVSFSLFHYYVFLVCNSHKFSVETTLNGVFVFHSLLLFHTLLLLKVVALLVT
jgi:hypothetical protein